MSGPWAEDAQLRIRTSVETSLWPLRIWADSGAAMIECAECDSGELLVAGSVDRPFVIADLTARVEAHIAKCVRRHFQRRMAEGVQFALTKLPTDPGAAARGFRREDTT